MNCQTTTRSTLGNTIRIATVALLAALALIVVAGDAQAIVLEGFDAGGGHVVTASGRHYVRYTTPSNILSAPDDTTIAVLRPITSLVGGPQER